VLLILVVLLPPPLLFVLLLLLVLLPLLEISCCWYCCHCWGSAANCLGIGAPAVLGRRDPLPPCCVLECCLLSTSRNFRNQDMFQLLSSDC
jgi:hypothetical protein